ncbi:probable inactive purple acid phosphatase 29 isoform X2 [Triticum aestivum]|uniref:probable inactive purple acid phosphatase 29 isoform X2 n=1 Tax=Triticum aestivum TaxID=4565 RepID=UPI001D024F33|nr:probable inactive purple acid phosphatase 29 isoform X2 [Triticum aestivum]
MHYADGRSTACEDVMPEQVAGCSDLNITAFLYRVIRAEDPDLVIFTVHYSRRWAAASSRRTTTTPVQIKASQSPT